MVSHPESASAKLDRITPRQRGDAAERNLTAGFWFCDAAVHTSEFVEQCKDATQQSLMRGFDERF